MKKQWFNSMVFKKELERRYGIKKSTDNRRGHDNSSYSNVDHLFGVKDIRNSISDDPFLVRDSNGDSYSIYFDSEKKIFEIDNDHSFLSELKSSLSNPYMYATQSSWNNYITNRIDSYLQSQICIDTSSEGDSNLESKDLESNDLESNDRKSNDPDFDSNDFDFDFTDSDPSDLDSSDFDFDFTDSDPSDLDSSDSDLDSKDLDSKDLDSKDLESNDRKSNDLEFNDLESNDLESNDLESNDLESNDRKSNDRDATPDYTKLWVQCEDEDCGKVNYKRFLKSQMHMCEYCGYYFKMSSSERIEFLIDSGTWDPMDEDMVSLDPIGFDSEENPTDKDMDPSIFYPEDNPMGEDIAEDNPEDDEELRLFLKSIGIDWDWEDNEEDELDELDLEDDEPYTDRLESYQTETGLTEAVQTGVGELNGIPVAIGVMDFEFIGGSMGSVVGEKITRLIEYATKQFLPLIIVCASGGARMQEGSLSLMQMAKISSALYDHQSNKKSFYVSILTSPTTGGVTASFGMLGNIIIAEPNAYIAFAGKRVIEETLKIPVPEGSQEAELLFFEKGLFDLMVPRELLKGVLSELLNLHSFFPLNSNSIK